MVDVTDMMLFVRNSSDDIVQWNRQRIVDALVGEAQLGVDNAEEIAREVEKQIIASETTLLTSSLVRELVDAKLMERGMLQARRKHMRIGFPLHDVRHLMLLENKGDANVPHSPEGTNLFIAEGIKREYAINDVFSQEITEAHISGDIHLHGLGHVDRLYSAIVSLEYLKKYGLKLPQAINTATPAKHAEVLLLHMIRFSTTLQGHLGGHLGWDALNIYFAPFIKGLSDKEIKQVAQMLVYEFSQLASGRGGQSIFCDIHLYWNIPLRLKNTKAIIAGGCESKKTYADYQEEAHKFLMALFEVYLEGDALGKPFIFPCPIVHVDEGMILSTDSKDIKALELLCNVATMKGNTVFAFDRNVPSPRFEMQGDAERIFCVHNVSLNLPRLGYRAQQDTPKVFALIDEVIALAVKAHQQKKDFINTLFTKQETSPLAFLKMNHDGETYFALADAIFSVGIVGLNELVLLLTGESLAQSTKAKKLGYEIMQHIHKIAIKKGDEVGLKIMLSQSHAETTAHRFARLDLKHFAPLSGRTVAGSIVSGGVYYTNSSHINVDAEISPFEKAKAESEIHPLIGAETITQIYLGTPFLATATVVDFIRRVFLETECRQIAFSPEFVFCVTCGALVANNCCGVCGSQELDIITRVTRYYGVQSACNKGKLSEFIKRKRHNDAFINP